MQAPNPPKRTQPGYEVSPDPSRLVTDRATFAYLADAFIPSPTGRGAGERAAAGGHCRDIHRNIQDFQP